MSKVDIKEQVSPAIPASDTARIVYDGDCPFCSRYVEKTRLDRALGKVELLNAREGGPLVDSLIRGGYDLDEGIVLVLGERIYHGADCMNALALMTSRSDLFNRMNAALFSSPRVAVVLYPVLRAGRNMTLRLLGRKKILPRG